MGEINVIQNKTNGFSETDVYNSDDLHQLRKWLAFADKDKRILEGKIEWEEYKQDTDKKRIYSLKRARDMQDSLSQIIKNRIAEIMDNSKETYQVEVNFVERAREAVGSGEMGRELFDTLMERAQGYGKEI